MIKIKKLNCGIRMAMEEVPHVQSCAIGLWTRTGAVNETKANTGISHLIEHMMFKGTGTRTAREIAEAVDRLGGQINAFTGKEGTCYYIKVLSSNLEPACEILIDMFLNSQFDKKELSKEKQVIYEEIKMVEDTPDDLVHDMLLEQVFKGKPLGQSVIGTQTSLKRITRDVLKAYIAEQYTKDSIVVSIAGNFDEEAMCRLFEERLSQLPPSKEQPQDAEPAYTPSCRVRVKDIEQSHLCMGVPCISLGDRRYYALSVLNNIMGGSMSSRFFQNIREEKGLAYSVYSGFGAFSGDGYYFIYAGISHDRVRDTLGAIVEELAILKRDGISEDELNMSKVQMKSSYIFGQENVNSRMFAMGKNAMLLNRAFTQEEVMSGIDAVDMEAVQEVAQLIQEPDRYCVSLVTNRRADLKAMLGRK